MEYLNDIYKLNKSLDWLQCVVSGVLAWACSLSWESRCCRFEITEYKVSYLYSLATRTTWVERHLTK